MIRLSSMIPHQVDCLCLALADLYVVSSLEQVLRVLPSHAQCTVSTISS